MALLNNNESDVVHLPSKHGADVNADHLPGRSPLFAAVEYRNRDLRHRDLVDELVHRTGVARRDHAARSAGANVNVRTRERPFSLTSFTSDLSWVDMTGQTPFVRAALAGDTTTMKLLLAHGADPTSRRSKEPRRSWPPPE